MTNMSHLKNLHETTQTRLALFFIKLPIDLIACMITPKYWGPHIEYLEVPPPFVKSTTKNGPREPWWVILSVKNWSLRSVGTNPNSRSLSAVQIKGLKSTNRNKKAENWDFRSSRPPKWAFVTPLWLILSVKDWSLRSAETNPNIRSWSGVKMNGMKTIWSNQMAEKSDF